MPLLSEYRPIRIRVFRDKNWAHPAFSKALPTFSEKQDIEEWDITGFVNNWTCSWSHGQPYGGIALQCGHIEDLLALNKNDIVLIERMSPNRVPELIMCGLINGVTRHRIINKQAIKTISIEAHEPSKILQDHEVYYNPYIDQLGAIQPLLEFTGGEMHLNGSPANIIRAFINMKLFGLNSKGEPTDFYGGFLFNDGRRAIDWFNPDHIIDQESGKILGTENTTKNLIKNDPCVLSYTAVNGSLLDGALWVLMQNYSGQPIQELFTYSRTGSGKQPEQMICLRPLPFWSAHYDFDLWDALECLEINDSDLSGSDNMGWSDSDFFDYFFAYSQQTCVGADTVALQSIVKKVSHDGLDLQIPISETALIQRYGFKKMIPSINSIAVDTNPLRKLSSDEILRALILRIWDHNFLNHCFVTGDFGIALKNDMPIPRTGFRFLNKTTGMEGYITRVSISGGIGKQTAVNIGFTRGMSRRVYQHLVQPEVRSAFLGNQK